MINIEQFADLQKKSKNSFANQKQLMKKVMAGKKILCTSCQQPLFLIPPKNNVPENFEHSGIRCEKGCTDIQLDFV